MNLQTKIFTKSLVNMSTTIVTSLYDIGREQLKGKNAYRPFAKYLDWFKNLLTINSPMVIFIDADLLDYVRKNRPKTYQTKVVVRKFQSLSAYEYHDRIQEAIDKMIKEPNKNGKIPKHFKECPEFITAKYQIIQYSKLDFLEEVSKENPFSSEYFIWLDAGTYQEATTFDSTFPWPDPYKMKIFGNKFLISEHSFNISDKSPLMDKKKYIRAHKNQVWGYIQGGTRKSIERIYKKFWEEVNSLLDVGITTNDQIILQIIALENPAHFYLWHQSTKNYVGVPTPTCDRMVPYELAVGTFIQEDYPINKNIKILTVATKNLNKKKFEKWERSVKHFGYNYEIIGRDVKWSGWKGRTKMYKDALEKVTEPYVALTDCNDLFFSGSSNELYDKLISLGDDLIVGGEMYCYYTNGKYPSEEVKDFFEKIKKSDHPFPNAGFITGKTEKVLKLKGSHTDCKDDQAGCFETIYNKEMDLKIDYKTTLVGNIPRVPGKNTNRFVFDSTLSRYKNIDSGEYPPVFHFSGSNFSVMKEFYYSIFPINKFTIQEIIAQENNKVSIWLWLIFAIIVTILICLLLLFP